MVGNIGIQEIQIEADVRKAFSERGQWDGKSPLSYVVGGCDLELSGGMSTEVFDASCNIAQILQDGASVFVEDSTCVGE